MSVLKPKPKISKSSGSAINDRGDMYGSTTNCVDQLLPPNRILLENVVVFQLEKKPYRESLPCS